MCYFIFILYYRAAVFFFFKVIHAFDMLHLFVSFFYKYMFRSLNEEITTNIQPLQVCTFCNVIQSPTHSDAVILNDKRQKGGGVI